MAQALLGGRGGSELPPHGSRTMCLRVTGESMSEWADQQLPDDLDPHEMADSLEDELVAEEGEELGLDPDLAIFAAQEELDEEGELPPG
jgi:hypothetical protein